MGKKKTTRKAKNTTKHGAAKNYQFDILRLRSSGVTYATEKEAPKIPMGKSRVGGPIIDLPKDQEFSRRLNFVAMLDLAWIGKFDKQGQLPKTGYLYFFEDRHGKGSASYFDGTRSDLRRVVREHDQNFYQGVTLTKCKSENESFSEWYDNDGEWAYFGGVEKTKLFGIHSNCQKGEKEILQELKSDKVLLFQIGEDITEEGVMYYVLPKGDLKKRKFDRCEGIWAQS